MARPRAREPENASTLALLGAIGVLYVSEGFPFGVVTELFPLYLRSSGFPLSQIGFVSAIGVAWTLKFLWAPLVDGMASYRAWTRWSIAIITACMLLLAVFGNANPAVFWTVAAILAFASATQDIAVDALAVSKSSPANVGAINSTRITTYRVALIAAGGGLAAIGSRFGWPAAFTVGAGVSALCLLSTGLLPGEASGRGTRSPLPAVRAWLGKPDMGPIVAIVFLYKIGDAALAPMIKPFWVDSGYGVAEIGTATTVIGVSCTIAGGIIGGIYITRRGLHRSLVDLGVLQMASNAGYAIAAMEGATRPAMYAASVVENVAGGLGTAAFLSFLMTVCDRENAATEFALLTALMGLSRMLAGTASGFLAQAMGFIPFFWLTLALGLPGLLVVIATGDRWRD